jgi:hypothetical protein
MAGQIFDGGWLMEFRTINVVVTELTVSLNFTDKINVLNTLHDLKNGLIWINGGNCRMVLREQIGEMHRTAHLFKQLMDETDVKKGPPPQHRIYWDDCPEIPSDLSALIKE